jgi:cation diffusion facilitator family transporter
MIASERQATIKKVTLVGIAINIVLSAAQIVSGILAHSQALLADGMHTLADLFSDFIVMITAHHSHREADASHPYGHARIETLSSIFLGFLLIAVALGMGYRGIQQMIEPSQAQTEAYALLFAFLAIVSKEFLYRYTLHAARNIKSTLLEANALHHRSDAFSSIVVVIGVGAQLAGVDHMDALAAIIVSVLIAIMGAHLVRKAFNELIDASLDQALVDAIREHVLATDGVMAVHRLRSRSMAGLGYIDLEIRVNPRLSVSEAHFISLHIEESIKRTFNEIIDVTVHIDPLSDNDHSKLMQLPNRARLLFSLYSAWEELEGAENIRNIHLHYLTDQIEVDVILPLTDTAGANNDLAQRLTDSIRQFPYIGKINVYYSR